MRCLFGHAWRPTLIPRRFQCTRCKRLIDRHKRVL